MLAQARAWVGLSTGIDYHNIKKQARLYDVNTTLPLRRIVSASLMPVLCPRAQKSCQLHPTPANEAKDLLPLIHKGFFVKSYCCLFVWISRVSLSKSSGGDSMSVRFRPPAPNHFASLINYLLFLFLVVPFILCLNCARVDSILYAYFNF